MVKVVINETHSLFPQQEEILNSQFGSFERIDIPNEGLNLQGIKQLAEDLEGGVVVASPIPALFTFLSRERKEFSVFHNDKRDKKTLPNGKVIHTVAKEGWVIL